MEIVKKTTLAYCDSTHLSSSRVQNTQNSRFADLWFSATGVSFFKLHKKGKKMDIYFGGP
jgi:hypothetical protein